MARSNRRLRRLRTRRVDAVAPSDQRVQIHVTFTPGQLIWLLTGVAIGKLSLTGRLLEYVGVLLRGLVSG
jgi:hypothetical protein